MELLEPLMGSHASVMHLVKFLNHPWISVLIDAFNSNFGVIINANALIAIHGGIKAAENVLKMQFLLASKPHASAKTQILSMMLKEIYVLHVDLTHHSMVWKMDVFVILVINSSMEFVIKLGLNAHLDKFNRILNVFVKKALLIMDHVKNAQLTPLPIHKERDVFVLTLIQSSEQIPSNVFHALLTLDPTIFLHYVSAILVSLKRVKTVSLNVV